MEEYYIIDTYSPYDRNDDVKYVFENNDKLWCVRAITEFEWGKPQFDELPFDDKYIQFNVYTNLADAIAFARILKGEII